MKPVIRAKRWWWLPDRRKAKIANKVMQYQMNKERQDYIDTVQRKMGGGTVNIKLNEDGTFSPLDPSKPSWFVTGDRNVPANVKHKGKRKVN